MEPDGRIADPGVVRRLLHTSQACALLVATVGVLGLVGWQADIALFKRVHPDLGAIAPGSAVALVLSGIALWLLHPRHDGTRRGWIAGVLPWPVLVLSGLTLAEYLLHIHLGIDQLFFPDPEREVHTAYPGRMSVVAALGFALLGTALRLIRADSRTAQRVARLMVLTTAVMLLVGLLGLLYGPASLYAVPIFRGVAVNTIAALLLLAAGILAVQPARGFSTLLASAGAGGRLARRLLPFAFVTPLALGWLRLQGEWAGLYQVELGVDLMVVAMVALFVGVIWWQARLLDIADTERRRTEQALRESEAAVRAMSLTDALTGLANRRRLDEGLRGEVERVHRYGGRLSVVIVDLDHFKEVNDTHGHQAGDDLLRAFAKRFRLHCREVDLVSRFGGEGS